MVRTRRQFQSTAPTPHPPLRTPRGANDHTTTILGPSKKLIGLNGVMDGSCLDNPGPSMFLVPTVASPPMAEKVRTSGGGASRRKTCWIRERSSIKHHPIQMLNTSLRLFTTSCHWILSSKIPFGFTTLATLYPLGFCKLEATILSVPLLTLTWRDQHRHRLMLKFSPPSSWYIGLGQRGLHVSGWS